MGKPTLKDCEHVAQVRSCTPHSPSRAGEKPRDHTQATVLGELVASAHLRAMETNHCCFLRNSFIDLREGAGREKCGCAVPLVFTG